MAPRRSRPAVQTPPIKARSSALVAAGSSSGRLLTLAAIASTALILRLFYISQIQAAPFFTMLMGDSKSYDAWARQIAAGDWIGREVFYQAPLYPYFLGLVYAVFGHDLHVVRVVQSCLGAIACALLAHAGWRLFSRRTGVVAGLCLACYAPAIFFDGLLQKTALDAFLTSVAIWLISGLIVRDSGWMSWAALGLTMAALSLTRENALLLAVVLGAWTCWSRTGAPAATSASTFPQWRRVLPFAAGLAVLLLPVTVRNAYVGGGFYLTTSQFGPNLYLGNNPVTDGTAGSLIGGRGAAEFERQDAIDFAERAAGRSLTPAEVSSYWTLQTLAYVRSQPGDWLQLMVRKTALLWNRAEAFDTESQESYAEWSPLLAALSSIGHFGVLVPLACLGVLFTWADRRRLAILYVLIVGYSASVVLFFIYARYRFPLVPMLTLFAAVALTEGVAFVRRASRAKLMGAAAAVTLSAAVAWWPLLDRRDMLAVTEHNLGAAFQSEGRLDEAIAQYRHAIATKPDYPPAFSNLGAALLARGDTTEAIAAYTQALALDPRFVDAHFNLGNALLARGDANGAVEHFRAGLALSPDAVDIRTNLGVALAASGRVDEGVRELEAVVANSPKSTTAWRTLGEVLSEHGPSPRAVDALQRAVALAPDDGAGHYALGRALLESNRIDEGIAALRVAVTHPPVAPEALGDLGIVLASRGQFDEASRFLSEALRVRPDFEEARRTLAMVRAEQARRPGR